MNCKRAQAQIALAVGGDLDDAAERELHQHRAGCIDCDRHWKQMNDTWTLLLDREDELPDPHDSVWPDLQVKLPNRRELMSRARFNGWAVGLAVAGVCLAMVSLWQTANTNEPSLELASPTNSAGLLPGERLPGVFASPFEQPAAFDPVPVGNDLLPVRSGEHQRSRPPLRVQVNGQFYILRP